MRFVVPGSQRAQMPGTLRRAGVLSDSAHDSYFLQNNAKICIILFCTPLEEELELCVVTELLFKPSLAFLLDCFSFDSAFPWVPN